MKQCKKCLDTKDLSDFTKNKNSKDGLCCYCRICKSQVDRDYYKNNSKEINKRRLSYHKTSPIPKECRKRYAKSEKGKIAQRKYVKKRYQSNLEFKIRTTLRSRLKHAIDGNIKKLSAIKLLGCTVEYFISYIESKLLPDMTWENYGNPNGNHSDCWHIDHIIPCARFNLVDLEQQKLCFHYTNLQPLWAKDNLSKADKIIS